jgi:hypothetical protein
MTMILSGLAALVGWTRPVHLSRVPALLAGGLAGLFAPGVYMLRKGSA